MGRTVRTFRDAVNIEAQRWTQFKRALRPRERELMAQIFDSARVRGDAGTMVTARTTEVVIMSALIDIIGSLKDFDQRLTRLETVAARQTRK